MKAKKAKDLLKSPESEITIDIAGERLNLQKLELEKVRELLIKLSQKLNVSIVEDETMLTTSEAAKLLCVSRPYVSRLIDEGKIKGFKVGKHRRVSLNDVITYRDQSKIRSHKAMQKLHDLSAEMGMYDDEVKK